MGTAHMVFTEGQPYRVQVTALDDTHVTYVRHPAGDGSPNPIAGEPVDPTPQTVPIAVFQQMIEPPGIPQVPPPEPPQPFEMPPQPPAESQS